MRCLTRAITSNINARKSIIKRMSASYCSCIFRFPICYMYYVIYINDWRCHLLLASLPFCCFNRDYARTSGNYSSDFSYKHLQRSRLVIPLGVSYLQTLSVFSLPQEDLNHSLKTKTLSGHIFTKLYLPPYRFERFYFTDSSSCRRRGIKPRIHTPPIPSLQAIPSC